MRKITYIPMVVAISVLTMATTASGATPQRPTAAHLSQTGRELVFSVRTSRPVPLAKLQPQPDIRRATSRYLCLGLVRPGHHGERQLCLGGSRAHRQLGVVIVNARGKPVRTGAAAATVRRPKPGKLVVSLVPADAGLGPQRFRWRVLESGGCRRRNRCAHLLPAAGARAFRLRPVRAVGCTDGHTTLVTHGPRDRRVVALTFDDGPSAYTPSFLQVLREKEVPGTFFVLGQEIADRETTLRRMLSEGHEIGDHTVNHVEFPSHSQIAGARSEIAAATHFTPCLFRPPGGGVNSGVIATAGALGMATIKWDVDPFDWQNPGSGAVYSRIVSATRSGSIILMHDGGGSRGGTLAALPGIIDTLRSRGYGFATVSELLGEKLIYRPYG